MMWTYRVFCDRQGQHSIREVFYERDGRIITYSKAPVTVVATSPAELIQLVKWFEEAFELPILSIEEIDTQITTKPAKPPSPQSSNLSLQQVKEQLELLATEIDSN